MSDPNVLVRLRLRPRISVVRVERLMGAPSLVARRQELYT